MEGSSLLTEIACKVSIIVVNWNGASLLNDCLGSLCRQLYGCTEIIFVDNGSTDFSVSYVKDKFPNVKVVELSENSGFAGGNALGLQVASGDFIALLNNDSRADERWLETIMQPMLQDPTAVD